MTLVGRFHPLLQHFPIALLIFGALAEIAAMLPRFRAWHFVAIINVRAGAIFAVATTATGWLLASSLAVDDGRALAWHQWIGTATTLAIVGAALATAGAGRQSAKMRRLYRIALFWAAALVGITGHLGARLVWGADFLRP